MKIFLRSIQFLLIFVLIGFIGIIPASSAEEIVFPDPYDCYRPYEVIINRMDELTDLYPDLAHLKTIGQSFDGLEIQVLQLGREVETDSKPRLVLVSGLQANALAKVELNLSFAESLLDSYGEDANVNWLLEEMEIHLILVANPDGRLIAEQQALSGVPTWTKNRNVTDCSNENAGVALGLNFDYGWAASSTDACADDYPGLSAASEPETQAIQTYLEQILAQNPERSLVIDLQNEADSALSNRLITPFLYDKTADNPLEDELYMLANKLAYNSQAAPLLGSETIGILTGNLTDFAFGDLQAPSLRFNLGPNEVTSCWYFDDFLKPEGLAALTRAALLAAGPLSQAQGPEVTFTNTEQDAFMVHIAGKANDRIFYKLWLEQDEYSAVHHVSYSLDTPPWLPGAVLTQVVGQRLPETPYVMEFEHTFYLRELTPGKHTAYFQAWDTDLSGDSGQAGMINSVEINVPFLTFIPLLIR
jgi:hypothetical protein